MLIRQTPKRYTASARKPGLVQSPSCTRKSSRSIASSGRSEEGLLVFNQSTHSSAAPITPELHLSSEVRKLAGDDMRSIEAATLAANTQPQDWPKQPRGWQAPQRIA